MSQVVTTVASVAYGLIATNGDKSNQEIATMVQEHFKVQHGREVKTSASCIAWYKNKKKTEIQQLATKLQQEQQVVTLESLQVKLQKLQDEATATELQIEEFKLQQQLEEEQKLQEFASKMTKEQLEAILAKM